MEREFDHPVTPDTKARMSFLERYEGFCIDMIKALAKRLKFKFEFHLEPDESYGGLVNGQWTGMIRELRTQQVEISENIFMKIFENISGRHGRDRHVHHGHQADRG